MAKAPADDVHDLPWAKDWNTARSIQLHSNKEVIAGCHECSHNSPTVQNMLNQGRLVQVDPIKPVLKAPGAKRLKLKNDKLLSRPSISTCAATPRCDSSLLLDPTASFSASCAANRLIPQRVPRSSVVSYGTLTCSSGAKRVRR